MAFLLFICLILKPAMEGHCTKLPDGVKQALISNINKHHGNSNTHDIPIEKQVSLEC